MLTGECRLLIIKALVFRIDVRVVLTLVYLALGFFRTFPFLVPVLPPHAPYQEGGGKIFLGALILAYRLIGKVIIFQKDIVIFPEINALRFYAGSQQNVV